MNKRFFATGLATSVSSLLLNAAAYSLAFVILCSPFAYSQTKPEPKNSDAIRRELSEIVAAGKAPGMIAAIISSRGVLAVGSAGVRKAGSDSAMTDHDLVHLGSCTKAMTAVMIATLVAEGKLGWETKLTEAIPELNKGLHPDYRGVTLWQLLTHRAGVVNNPAAWGAHMEKEIKERRLALLIENLSRPAATPQGEFNYSNFGYMIAASLAEKVTGSSWEALMKKRVFDPLGMSSAGFGEPDAGGAVDQPWGHAGSGGKWFPSRDYDEEALGPAGEIHCTVEDWGKFLALQMGGPHPLLDHEHLNKLLEPVGFYAGGWGIIDGLEWAKGKAHTHNGSNGLWFATVLVAPGIDRAFVVVTNSRDFVSTRDLCAEMITTLKALDARKADDEETSRPPVRDSAPEVRVTYVGNAGFLIAIDDKKILIDALFSGFPGGYTLPADIRDKLALGRPPFDGIDLALATHSHGDHFEAALVRRFLAANPAAVFGSTPQAVASLNGFPGRVITFQPGKNKAAVEDIRGIHVEAIYLSHGAPAAGREEILNYGYLVTVNGITLFHSGDIDAAFIGFEAFRSLRLPEKKIDLAFLQHFYLLDDPVESKLIREGVAARHVIPAHYHYTEPALNRVAVMKNYPEAVLFEAELQSWVMPRPQASPPIRKTAEPRQAAGATGEAGGTGAYLGQNPPGDTLEVFAPGIVSLEDRLEAYPTFSADGRELFFSVVNAAWTAGEILYTRLKDGVWSKPEKAPFSAGSSINWESCLSPDGKRLFFASNRPPSSAASIDLWMVEREAGGAWSDPVRLPEPVNSAADDGSACVTNDGTLYFHSSRGGGIGGSELYQARLIDRTNARVDGLGGIIKSGPKESEPYMAPDESYLIFISQTRPGGKGGWDLWISFRKADGSWAEPVNMGPEINTAADEYGPRVTADGKYLFVTREVRGRSMDIHWISAKVIDRLKANRG